MNSLILATALTTSIVRGDMDEAARYRAMRPFFDPPPGENVEVFKEDALILQSHRDNPVLYKLYVTVTPPKGACFTITRNPNHPDDRICRKTKLALPVGQINDSGAFIWKISTGPGDFGHFYRWQTPHRMAQFIKAGEKKVHFVPIFSCTPQFTATGRRILLQLMNGEHWTINYPNEDVLANQPPGFPNLYIADTAPKGGISEDSKVRTERSNPYGHLKTPKPSDPVTTHWTVPRRRTYVMSASNFKITDTAPGMRGSCRYRYSGAANDPEAGWIECHEVDVYDVVFSHIPCASALRKPAKHR